MQRDLWDKIWRDKRGHIVIFQWPNKWLIGWASLAFLSLVFTGVLSDVLSWAGIASLLIWCYLEISQGVNYFRKAFGVAVLIYAVMAIINNF